MENIFWGGEMMKLESVALQESKILEWKETLQKAVQTSLIPLKAYAEGSISSRFFSLLKIFFFVAYEPYVALMNLNIDQYIKFVDEKNR